MPSAPIYSTITLLTEIVVTIFIFYVFYSGYKKNKFPYKIAFFTLSYEIIFNISYMLSRAVIHVKNPRLPAKEVALAAFHGIASLIMFITLVIYLVIAWKKYKKGINYFKNHKIIMLVFLFFWLIAVISGITFYFVEYF